MGLESATYISGLNSVNPVTDDAKTEGDDHLRLIKSTLLATFPNVTGAVTPTHTELNYVDGVTSSIQTQLDAKSPPAAGAASFRGITSSSETVSTTTFDTFTEVYDTTSAFNHTTGAFTVPTTGNYLFVADWSCTFSSAGSASIQIYNSTATSYIAGGGYIIDGATGTLPLGTVTGLVRCTAGDSIIVRTGSLTNATAQLGSFSGYQLA